MDGNRSQDAPRAPVVNEFLKLLEASELSCDTNEIDNKVTPAKPSTKFVCIDAVRAYFGGGPRYHRLETLLDGLYHGNHEGHKPEARAIIRSESYGSQSYVAILCILTKLSQGAMIHLFIPNRLHDDILPFSFTKPNEHFPLDTPYKDFYRDFCNTQWMFCVPRFNSGMTDNFEIGRILPITKKKVRPDGAHGSAKVYEIQLHACYNGFHNTSRRICSSFQADHSEDEALNPKDQALNSKDEALNTFIVKTYDIAATLRAQREYNTEKIAYTTLRADLRADRSHIVDFYGYFEDKATGTGNVILEKADVGTLEEYFQNYRPPSEAGDIRNFWKGLYQILPALGSIHYIKDILNGRVTYGWHQDVKPQNVLVFSNKRQSPYEFQFKLTDFGTSHFENSNNVGPKKKAIDSYGTSTYGAPECHRNEAVHASPLPVIPKVDIWSCGCVLSEAAAWMNNGYDGVVRYHEELRKEKPEFGVCFHDGIRTSQAVKRWHNKIRDTRRISDQITPGVLEQIEEHMLLATPSSRMGAFTIASRADDKFLREGYLLEMDGMPKTASRSQFSHYVSPAPMAILAPAKLSRPPIHPDPPNTNPLVDLPLVTTPLSPSNAHNINPFNPDLALNKSRYPFTCRLLKEQAQTDANCRKILSYLSKGEDSFSEDDTETAFGHFNSARMALKRLENSADKSNQTRKNARYELHMQSWTGLTKCKIATLVQNPAVLSVEQKLEIKTKAEYYANGAFQAYKMIYPEDPNGNACEALKLCK